MAPAPAMCDVRAEVSMESELAEVECKASKIAADAAQVTFIHLHMCTLSVLTLSQISHVVAGARTGCAAGC